MQCGLGQISSFWRPQFCHPYNETARLDCSECACCSRNPLCGSVIPQTFVGGGLQVDSLHSVYHRLPSGLLPSLASPSPTVLLADLLALSCLLFPNTCASWARCSCFFACIFRHLFHPLDIISARRTPMHSSIPSSNILSHRMTLPGTMKRVCRADPDLNPASNTYDLEPAILTLEPQIH